jgi:hypothetical protein
MERVFTFLNSDIGQLLCGLTAIAMTIGSMSL